MIPVIAGNPRAKKEENPDSRRLRGAWRWLKKDRKKKASATASEVAHRRAAIYSRSMMKSELSPTLPHSSFNAEVDHQAKRPNKAPEPTTMAVTPRAIEGDSK